MYHYLMSYDGLTRIIATCLLFETLGRYKLESLKPARARQAQKELPELTSTQFHTGSAQQMYLKGIVH